MITTETNNIYPGMNQYIIQQKIGGGWYSVNLYIGEKNYFCFDYLTEIKHYNFLIKKYPHRKYRFVVKKLAQYGRYTKNREPEILNLLKMGFSVRKIEEVAGVTGKPVTRIRKKYKGQYPEPEKITKPPRERKPRKIWMKRYTFRLPAELGKKVDEEILSQGISPTIFFNDLVAEKFGLSKKIYFRRKKVIVFKPKKIYSFRLKNNLSKFVTGNPTEFFKNLVTEWSEEK